METVYTTLPRKRGVVTYKSKTYPVPADLVEWTEQKLDEGLHRTLSSIVAQPLTTSRRT